MLSTVIDGVSALTTSTPLTLSITFQELYNEPRKLFIWMAMSSLGSIGIDWGYQRGRVCDL